MSGKDACGGELGKANQYDEGKEVSTTKRTYVCKRSRMCSYLMERGFSPYRITPDRDNPKYNVYLFSATPELHRAVMDYVVSKQKLDERRN